eukprot:scaffold1353_cov169-Chaetoceros_neogracile.AAC.1
MSSQSGLPTDIANKPIDYSSASVASASTQAHIVVDNILSSFFWFDISEALHISKASILSCFSFNFAMHSCNATRYIS